MVEFTTEVFDSICAQIEEGKSLRSICKADNMPSTASVCRWLAADKSLREQYARAREAQADTIFDECLEIADQYNPDNDMLNPEHIQRAKLRIDTRKWMAGKLRPKKYGDKLAIGGDEDMGPIKTEEIGQGSAKLIAALDSIAERSRTDS